MIVLLLCTFTNKAQVNLEEVKKDANKLFEDDEFTSAYKFYSLLVANYPKDPEYNYRLGVCMIYSEPDKKKCISYLKTAAANPKEAPKDVNFYLGKAYHINYRFDEAIRYYNEFKKTASASLQKKMQVDREIKACGNGKLLLSSLTDLVIQSKKSLNEADYFRSYDLKSIGGKLLVKPDEFKSTIDKKKKEKSVVFLPKGSNVVYYSSYGETPENGRDIYTVARLPSGEFGKPQKIQGINTEFDEDFPFLHPDGKTLYFSSKGYNSMGGYDIFRTVYDEETDTWSKPQNMEFPINSPDDDILFVTDSLEKTAYFSTGRQSPPGKIDVLKISTERKPFDILAIKGKVIKETPEQSIKSIVSIKNLANGIGIGPYEAMDDGEYDLELPNGAKLLFTVETPGLKTQSQQVELPLARSSRPYLQTIAYEKGILKITTQLNESDSSYLQYLKIIEKKARLDVNEGDNKLESAEATVASKTKKDIKPQIVEEHPGAAVSTNNPTTKPNTAVDNKQLVKMAGQDATESYQEAEQMKRDAADAYETGRKQSEEADKKLAEANDAIKGAENISNEEDKKSVLSKAEELKKSAENDKIVSEKIIKFAQSLEKDAEHKLKEAELNRQYAAELEKSTLAKNKTEAFAKVEQLQQQITEHGARKNESENVVNAIKTEVEEKEAQLSKIEKTNSEIKSNLTEITTEIADNEANLEKTKKKAAKAEIITKLEELKADKAGKEKQIATNDADMAKINEELSTLKSELELTTRIKTEDIVVSTPTLAIANNTSTPIKDNAAITSEPKTNVANEKLNTESLKEKYATKIPDNSSTDKAVIEESIAVLNDYNKDIDKVIGDKRTQLTKTKQAQTKQKINAEIKQLENLKKQNQQQIAANTTKLQKAETTAVGITQTPVAEVKDVYAPLTANNKQEAVSKLNSLEKQLVFNDNDNFDYNAYQNPQAQALKVEADARINDAVARQKKLKDEISGARTAIQNAAETNTTATVPLGDPEKLNKEADDLHNQSAQKLSEAKTKQGEEKDRLIAESRELENKSNQKHVEVAEITRNENALTFNTNTENIDNLVKEKKSSETDVSQARQLNEDAQLAYKKSQEIRAEAASQTNVGAKLGALSNAEEKEAEAILKQQQALDLLKKSNPEFVLKTPADAKNQAASTGTSVSNTKLEPVNEGLNELMTIKTESYAKLAEANTSELSDLETEIKNKQDVMDNNPVLKSEYIAAAKKLEAAAELKQQSANATEPGDKLNKLIASVKKQNEAIKQLNTLKTKIDNSPGTASAATNTATSATNTASANSTPTLAASTETPAATTETPVVLPDGPINTTTATSLPDTGNEPVVTNTAASVTPASNNGTTTTAKTANTTNTNNPVAANNSSTTAANTLNAEELKQLAKNDTTTGHVLSYFNETTPTLNNPQAENMLKQSLNRLKNYEADVNSVDKKITKSDEAPPANGNTEGVTAAEVKSKSDALLVESDELGTLALQTRKEAQNKTGAEKDSLIARAKELETKSLDKSIEGAELLFQSNEIDVATNNNAIDELLVKLRNDNPELSVDLAAKKDDLANLKSQIKKLRDEAEAQTNKAAKLGALNNAEEREIELIQKQEQLIAELKKQYPDYVIKPVTSADLNPAPTESKESLLQKKKEIRNNQFAELTNLTNAFSLEYESKKNKIPKNLNANDQQVKQRAQGLNAESKRLLIKSAQEKNDNEKMKLLSQAAKLGSEAIDQLNKIIPATALATTNPPVSGSNTVTNQPNTNQPLAANTKTTTAIGPNTGTVTTNKQPNNTSTVAPSPNNNNATNDIGTTVRIPGMEIRQGDAYTNARPIPMNAKVEDGLIFRVQIGAFKTQLPNNAFKGLNPLNGETTANGYFRYTAGNFNKYEFANAVKNDLRNLGYTDAFVVAYYNGKRITLGEAIDLLAKEGKSIDNNAPQSAGITANSNIPRAAANPAVPEQKAVIVSKELEKVNGLLYTIQIGVYNRQVTGLQLKNLKPIFTEQLPGGLFRYTAGIYNNTDRLISDKTKIINLGIKDAFVSAYLNGKKIPFAEAKTKQSTDSTIKMEVQDPVIFPEGDSNAPANNTAANNAAPAVQPFTNGVSAYPAATTDNGVKANENGISFKVQIGAYSKQVPADVSAKFLAIKTWPVESKQANGLYIYNIGNFTDAKFAKQLKDEAIRLGLNDAFITVYKDGKKLYGAEASGYLSR